jgi:hypothetical protein
VTDDPHRLRPDHQPTPFTADEIRLGCPPGRTIRSLIVRVGSEPYVNVSRFLGGDTNGANQEFWTETPDGVRLTESERAWSTWLELQAHASMPRATTEITGEEIDIPAGRFDCLKYVRRDDGGVSTFWFARSAPGMPLLFEKRGLDGELLFSSTAISDVVEAVDAARPASG